jgi:hypothetical protein
MATAAKQDTLGLLAMGSIIVNLAQGEAHSKLTAWYDQLRVKYGFICRDYLALRKVNEGLQSQAREYERIIDKLRVENGQLQKRLSEGKGN